MCNDTTSHAVGVTLTALLEHADLPGWCAAKSLTLRVCPSQRGGPNTVVAAALEGYEGDDVPQLEGVCVLLLGRARDWTGTWLSAAKEALWVQARLADSKVSRAVGRQGS